MVGVLRCRRSVLLTRSNARKREDHCCHQHVKAADTACSESPGDVQRSENSSGWFVSARHATQVFILLSVSNRPSEVEAQRDLARKVGRPDCGSSRSASHRLGRSGSHAREVRWLLLDSTALGTDRSVSCQNQRTTSKTASPATARSRSA